MKRIKVNIKRSLIALLGLTALLMFGVGATYSNVVSTNSGVNSTAQYSTISPENNLPSFYSPPNPLPYAKPGTIIKYETVSGVSGVPSGATLYRILYHSTSIYGKDIVVSGYVVVPSAPPPASGYPILTWAHGTTGVANACAPSLFTFPGGGGPYLSPYLSTFMSDGFVVAATDYEGLGEAQLHPYLLGESEGRSVLDAALAARQLPGVVTSSTTIIFGHSQGGHAALFAGQLAKSYAPSLNVIGVVAGAPATNLSVITAVAPTTYLPSGARNFVLMAAWTWSHTYRNLPVSDLLTPTGAELALKYQNMSCDGIINLTPYANSDLFAANISANPLVMDYARLNDPGRAATPAPILVVQGTADTTVPQFLTNGYVSNFACPIGDTIDYLTYQGANHGSVLAMAAADVQNWIEARLSNQTPPTTCGLPGDSQPGT